VLGANDGIVSTASLIVGVAAATATRNDVLIAGVAGLVAGAMSMAAGEYVSVSSQSDTERTDITRETKELSDNVEFELDELADVYVTRGADRELALQVAAQMMAKDALTAHARDELGISEITTARPVQAALTSAATFSLGAAMPLLMVVVAPEVVTRTTRSCFSPFDIDTLSALMTRRREAWASGGDHWPQGRVYRRRPSASRRGSAKLP